jgi:hypothetical protein
MKNFKILLITLATGVALLSCKNEKQTNAEKEVVAYETYVDSLNNIMITDLKTDWDSIENNHEKRKLAAENAIQEIEDRKELENKILVSNEKYELYKTSYLIQQPKAVIKSTIRTALFGSSDIGDDMMFTWVNKDNILKVYDTFTSTVEKNKATYSREDWDEIKLLYEALDTRKNTVENEGLTGTDNMKIASIKFKFAPLLKINRITSKAEENEEAKE